MFGSTSLKFMERYIAVEGRRLSTANIHKNSGLKVPEDFKKAWYSLIPAQPVCLFSLFQNYHQCAQRCHFREVVSLHRAPPWYLVWLLLQLRREERRVTEAG